MRPTVLLASATLILAACASPAGEGSSTSALTQSNAPPSAVASVSSAGGTAATPDCDVAFSEAAAIDDMHDAVEDLDRAVVDCVSLDDWAAASAANPGAIEAGVDPFEFLGNRCDSGQGLATTSLCHELLAACGNPPYRDTTYCLSQ